MTVRGWSPLVIAAGLFVMGLGWIVLWYRLVALGLLAMFLGIVGMAFEYPTFGQFNPEAIAESALGLDNRKLGIWAFLGSECVFFAESNGKFDLKPADAGKPPAKK